MSYKDKILHHVCYTWCNLCEKNKGGNKCPDFKELENLLNKYRDSIIKDAFIINKAVEKSKCARCKSKVQK